MACMVGMTLTEESHHSRPMPSQQVTNNSTTHLMMTRWLSYTPFGFYCFILIISEFCELKNGLIFQSIYTRALHNAAFGPTKMQHCVNSALLKFKYFFNVNAMFHRCVSYFISVNPRFQCCVSFLSALYQGSALCKNFQELFSHQRYVTLIDDQKNTIFWYP